MREAKNLIIKIASLNSKENIERMNQCLHVIEDVDHSLHEITKTKDNAAHKNDANIMDHYGFDYKFNKNFADKEL